MPGAGVECAGNGTGKGRGCVRGQAGGLTGREDRVAGARRLQRTPGHEDPTSWAMAGGRGGFEGRF